MSVTNAILSIVASGVMLFVGWYFKDLWKEIYQKYQDQKNAADMKQARTDAQAQNQQENAESDRLKQIDGR